MKTIDKLPPANGKTSVDTCLNNDFSLQAPWSKALIVLLIVPCFILVNIPLPGYADTSPDGPSLEIKHSPISSIKSGETVAVSAKLKDREGVELVRIYFRSEGTKSYYFVPMIVSKDDEYFGLLPAPLSTTKRIEYLFLVKTYNNRIFTSQPFTTPVTKQKDSTKGNDLDHIDVSTENTVLPETVVGFDMMSRVRLVTKPEKHGTAAGLYTHGETGGTTSTGRFHGTVIASKDSNLKTMLIIGGVAVGAAAVGLAAGGGGGSSSSSTGVVAVVDDATGAGQWTLNFEYSPCSKTTSQTVSCSSEGLVTAVSPTAIGVPLPASCANSPYAGVAEVFIVGGSCDTVTACNSYAPADLASRACENSSMVFQKSGGDRVERWSK